MISIYDDRDTREIFEMRRRGLFKFCREFHSIDRESENKNISISIETSRALQIAGAS